ncbi:hypothetical protein [Sphaerisporangium aureirubrum]|uniref:Uncharacterized protein n=1 Tax=Sphaerisporangium aureirubrum TaxID=1544736 RepID=A0ABW1N9K1_9ACTN
MTNTTVAVTTDAQNASINAMRLRITNSPADMVIAAQLLLPGLTHGIDPTFGAAMTADPYL